VRNHNADDNGGDWIPEHAPGVQRQWQLRHNNSDAHPDGDSESDRHHRSDRYTNSHGQPERDNRSNSDANGDT
jgi:hypothetical protein